MVEEPLGEVVCLFGFSPSQEPDCLGRQVIAFRPVYGIPFPYEVPIEGEGCDLAKFQALCQGHLFQSFSYIVNPDVPADELSFLHRLVQRCQEIEWSCQLAASDQQDFGLQVFRNVLGSGTLPVDERSFFSMKGLYEGVPAFICGGGPSLSENLVLLRQAHEKGMVFAGGAALGILAHGGVEVDVAGGVDPDPLRETVRMQGGFEVPFFFRFRFSFDCLSDVEGPCFCIPGGGCDPLDDWLFEQETFEAGWTVSTFLVALAAYLGCYPIILVGVDLAGDGDVLCEGVKTKKDWVLAGRWLQAFQREKGGLYTTSMQGLSLEGIERSSLASWLQTLQPLDSGALRHLLASLWKEGGERRKKLRELRESVERSLLLVEGLLSLFHKCYPHSPEEKGEFVLLLFDLQEEASYRVLLDPLWQVWKCPIELKLSDGYAKKVNQLLFFQRVLRQYKREYEEEDATGR